MLNVFNGFELLFKPGRRPQLNFSRPRTERRHNSLPRLLVLKASGSIWVPWVLLFKDQISGWKIIVRSIWSIEMSTSLGNSEKWAAWFYNGFSSARGSEFQHKTLDVDRFWGKKLTASDRWSGWIEDQEFFFGKGQLQRNAGKSAGHCCSWNSAGWAPTELQLYLVWNIFEFGFVSENYLQQVGVFWIKINRGSIQKVLAPKCNSEKHLFLLQAQLGD